MVPPPIGTEDNVPPPPFPPEELEAQYQSYIPEEGREKYVFYAKEQLLIKTLIRYGERIHVLCRDRRECRNTTYSDRIYFHGLKTG